MTNPKEPTVDQIRKELFVEAKLYVSEVVKREGPNPELDYINGGEWVIDEVLAPLQQELDAALSEIKYANKRWDDDKECAVKMSARLSTLENLLREALRWHQSRYVESGAEKILIDSIKSALESKQ